jgi:hypothetical protein
MIAVSLAGFAPSIIDPSRRLAPLTVLVEVHSILLCLWLLLFLLQTTLIAGRRVDLHRRMGIVAVVLMTVLVPLSYAVTVQMVRRGFDLSGDQGIKTDPLFGCIFNLVVLVEFALLGGIGLVYRKKKDIHKRFMLFATLSLMEASITHLLGRLGIFSPAPLLLGFAILYLSGVAWDYTTTRRVHPLTATLAIGLFLVNPIAATVGTTAVWHHFAAWLTR